MNENQSFFELPIYIIPDTVPEFDERFSVRILPNTTKGGSVVGKISRCDVVILESDYPYGLIGNQFINMYLNLFYK